MFEDAFTLILMTLALISFGVLTWMLVPPIRYRWTGPHWEEKTPKPSEDEVVYDYGGDAYLFGDCMSTMPLGATVVCPNPHCRAQIEHVAPYISFAATADCMLRLACPGCRTSLWVGRIAEAEQGLGEIVNKYGVSGNFTKKGVTVVAD